VSSEPTSAPKSTPEIELTLRLGRFAHDYGLPGYELEGWMTDVGAAMGLTGSVFATPNFVDYTVERRQGDGQRRMMVQLGDVSYNLEKLSQTLRLAERIRTSSVSVEQANRRLDEIETLRPPYPVVAAGVAYAACGAGFAVILSAAWGDVAMAAALSIVVFLLVQASSRSEWLANRIAVVASFVASSLAGVVGVLSGSSNSYIVGLCAFVVLIPGLGLTLGIYELAIGHTLLGWNRFIGAAVVTFGLFAGSSGGAMAVRALVGSADVPNASAPPEQVQWLFLVLLMMGLVVVFQVPPRQAPWAIVAGVLAYGGLELGGRAGVWQGPFLGALVLGLFAGLFVRLRVHANPLIVVFPGILILVPGVAAYASLRTIDASQGSVSINSFEGVLFQIVAILAGLFVAGSVTALPHFRRTPARTDRNGKKPT
jgi:uncharacterized membrane protein YjjP (DUF1212 family)